MRKQPHKSDDHVSLAEDILRESREELSRADAKAALLLAAAGIVISALLAALAAGDWQPTEMAICAQWVWWIGNLAGAAGVVAFASAVYPRTKYRGQRPPAVIAFFGDVVSTPADQLRARLKATAATDGDRLVDQLKAVSTIVDTKYRGIQLGLWLFAACATLCVVSVFADGVLHR